MNTQQLRNSILQEAIQGRLVPQDPNDEPASVLLDRIREEKKRLVKEGKLKKKDLEETPISEDEKPFDIPKSWEWCRVGDIIYPPKYGTSNKSSLQGEVAVLRMGNIQDGEIVFDKLVFSNNKADNDKYNLIAGDLLFNRTNSAELVGKTGIYRGQQKAIYAGYLILLRPIGTISDYLNYVLGSSYARSYCKEVKTIGVQQCNINAEKISTFVIPLPPLAEQKRIVAKIEELLPKVEEYGKAQEALNKLNEELPERLKKSILQEAITGRLVPQDPNDEPASVLLDKIRAEKKRLVKEGKLKKKDLEETPISEDEIPYKIPESWEWVRWGALGEYKKGPFGSSLTKSMFVPKSDKAIKVYEQKNAIQKDYSLGEYYISEQKYGEMKGFTIHPGDIIVSCAGTIGETYLLPKEAPLGIINQALMRAKIHLDSIIPYWLLYFRYILVIENKLKGPGSAIKNIPPFEVLKAMPVALPPLAEQKRIVAKIEEVFKEIDKLKK